MNIYVDVSPLCHALSNRQEMAPQITATSGPVHIAINVASMVSNFIRYYNATRVYFCMDHNTGNWRKKLYPSYKEGRQEKMDEQAKLIYELASKAATEVFPELVQLLEVPEFQMPYVEADDWVAACTVVNDGTKGVIITTDKDFWQLTTPECFVVNPVHNYRIEVGPTGSLQKVKADGTVEDIGLTSEQYLLFRAIDGDTSDNLPGLYGIGPKKAIAAIQKKQVPQLITENTKEINPRASKSNPNPQKYFQDARSVLTTNLRFMSLKSNEVSQKVQTKVLEIQAQGIRDQRNNYTKMILWLENHGISNDEIARQLVAAYTNQWLR